MELFFIKRASSLEKKYECIYPWNFRIKSKPFSNGEIFIQESVCYLDIRTEISVEHPLEKAGMVSTCWLKCPLWRGRERQIPGTCWPAVPASTVCRRSQWETYTQGGFTSWAVTPKVGPWSPYTHAHRHTHVTMLTQHICILLIKIKGHCKNVVRKRCLRGKHIAVIADWDFTIWAR